MVSIEDAAAGRKKRRTSVRQLSLTSWLSSSHIYLTIR
jgi:hypothetical protein